MVKKLISNTKKKNILRKNQKLKDIYDLKRSLQNFFVLRLKEFYASGIYDLSRLERSHGIDLRLATADPELG